MPTKTILCCFVEVSPATATNIHHVKHILQREGYGLYLANINKLTEKLDVPPFHNLAEIEAVLEGK